MKKHTRFLTGIFSIMLVFGLSLFTGCPEEDDHYDDYYSDDYYGPSTYTYAVWYSANGGSGSIDTQYVYNIGSSITLSDGSGFTRTGYTLIGWNTDRYGTGTHYDVGASVTLTGSLNLYAEWREAEYYTVSFDANGGSRTYDYYSVETSRSLWESTTTTLPDAGSSYYSYYNESSYSGSYSYYSGLTKYGYTFSGWNTSSDGTGTHYDADASYTVPSEDVTLYAQWTEIVQISENVYVGVVAFNNATDEFALSKNLGRAKIFIHNKDNDVDSTALCYAVSRATALFGAADLPTLDNLFVVSFTDGIDNYSSTLYTGGVAQGQVYDKANTDLLAINGLKSYAIGFGNTLNATDMQKLVVNGGQYRTATSGNLNQVFQSIANSVLASSRNLSLVTQNGVYTEAYPKYFRLTIRATSENTYTATLKCKLVGTTLTIIPSGSDQYTTFDEATAIGTVEGTKLHIPLNNLKYVRDGTEYYIEQITVEVSTTSADTGYYTDVEDSSTSTGNMTKKIGIALVLDCSGSLGSSFESVQTSAKNFIDTLLASDTQE